MVTHYGIFAWKIPWTEEPGGLQFMGKCRIQLTEQIHLNQDHISDQRSTDKLVKMY